MSSFNTTEEFYEQSYIVSENMMKYGGSFVKCLGEALRRADYRNKMRIYLSFRDYWNEYLNFNP